MIFVLFCFYEAVRNLVRCVPWFIIVQLAIDISVFVWISGGQPGIDVLRPGVSVVKVWAMEFWNKWRELIGEMRLKKFLLRYYPPGKCLLSH